MPFTETEIASQALGRLNDVELTTDDYENGNSKPARLARLYMAPAIEGVLRAHKWNFASARAILVAATDTPAFGYAYQYPIPADCMRVFSLNQVDPESEPAYYFEVEGKYILTDETEAKICYTKRVDVSLFDPLAAECVVLALAYRIAFPLLGIAKGQQILEEYQKTLVGLAWSVDSQEGNPKPKNRFAGSRWFRARYSRPIH